MESRRYQHNLIAVCQMTAKNNKIDNFEVSKKLIEDASSAGAKVGLWSMGIHPNKS